MNLRLVTDETEFDRHKRLAKVARALAKTMTGLDPDTIVAHVPSKFVKNIHPGFKWDYVVIPPPEHTSPLYLHYMEKAEVFLMSLDDQR